MKRVGGKWPHPYIAVDGDKFVCMDDFQSNNDCLVYSFGIANDWTFEDFIVQFGCSVFAYDPSVKYPPTRGQFIHFEQKGLADFYSSNMNTLLNFFKNNGHLGKTVQYLKVCLQKSFDIQLMLIPDRYRKSRAGMLCRLAGQWGSRQCEADRVGASPYQIAHRSKVKFEKHKAGLS